MRPTTIGPQNIAKAAEYVLRQHGAASFTLDRVSEAAKCAKGLVHYHFGSRTKLLAAANDLLWDDRERNWTSALGGTSPEACVRQSWVLLSTEAATGVTRAWLSLLVEPEPPTLQAVRRRMDRFDSTVLVAASALLTSLGLAPTIPASEWGRLVTAGIEGLGIQLVAQGRGQSLEAVYSAVWLAALGLTQPRG